MVKSGEIAQVTIDGRDIKGKLGNGNVFATYSPETDNRALVGDLLEHGVDIKGVPPESQSVLMQIFISWFPFLLLIGIWVFFMRQMQGGAGGRGAMSFGKSKARMLGEDQVNVTFEDVAGAEEAKAEVAELVDFLRDPGKFQKLGGRIPSGILMVGSPGTGKTLLAKAIAGEAKVPFFTISGSDFVEMFVGVGASRVRDMFETAKKHAPCIIFIDEIDAVGRHRGAGLGGGHDEREQTLNQLLVEMDGFEGNEGVIVMAATNRPDVLDPALLRPGRFDRQVVVPLPDIRGREQILKVHMRKVPKDDNVDALIIARGTPGFSGADLANLVNEAALFAARESCKVVSMSHFERAKDKIMMGAERRSMVMSEEDKKLTAYHEAGHAIVGRLVPEHDPVYKVSIIPRPDREPAQLSRGLNSMPPLFRKLLRASSAATGARPAAVTRYTPLPKSSSSTAGSAGVPLMTPTGPTPSEGTVMRTERVSEPSSSGLRPTWIVRGIFASSSMKAPEGSTVTTDGLSALACITIGCTNVVSRVATAPAFTSIVAAVTVIPPLESLCSGPSFTMKLARVARMSASAKLRSVSDSAEMSDAPVMMVLEMVYVRVDATKATRADPDTHKAYSL